MSNQNRKMLYGKNNKYSVYELVRMTSSFPGPEVATDKCKSITTALNPTSLFSASDSAHQHKKPRLVTKNGTINITHKNISKRKRRYFADIFTTLIDIQWRYLVVIFALGFLGSWIAFGGVWYVISYVHGDFNGTRITDETACIANVHDFTTVLLFSMETQTTIGYGSRHVTDKCPEGVFLVMFQSVIGALLQALLTGLIFVKVQKAKRRAQTLLFSKNACIYYQDETMWLTLRVGDMRKSHMIDCVVRAVCVKSKITNENYYIPYFQHVVKFGMADGQDRMCLRWPVIIKHRITRESPFWDIGPEDLTQTNFELIVFLEGVLESTSMMVQARTSFVPGEILWGYRFKPMLPTVADNGELNYDYSNFHATVLSPGTPKCSAKKVEPALDYNQINNENVFIGTDNASFGSHLFEPLTWNTQTGMRFLIRAKQSDDIIKEKD